MSLTSHAQPRVTIVMTARERHSLTVSAIQSIAANTSTPYRLLYCGAGTPEGLRRTLENGASDWHLDIVEFDAALWPNQIRNLIASQIDTEYVVFLDNDISVAPGWLEALVACADETKAGIVCPLYLIGAGASTTHIHMAGGHLTASTDAKGRVLEESHRLADHDLQDAAQGLKREPCDFAEYHGVLMRTELAKTPGLFDEDIVCVHEHIDAALTAKKHGYAIYFEPAARITYWALAPYFLSDLNFFRARWPYAAVESSIRAFAAKWGVADDERGIGSIRNWAQRHLGERDPLRPVTRAASPRPALQAAELCQTPSALFELAATRRYRPVEREMLERAYRLATVFTNGIYRPCGRPFLNHLVGTAGVLMHYDFKVPIVVAGLLHAAYTHGVGGASDRKTILDMAEALRRIHDPLERRVRCYTSRSNRWRTVLDLGGSAALTISDAEILAIEAANDADMHLSGEFRLSGRRDMVREPVLGLMACACDTIGVPGLFATLEAEKTKLARVAAVTKENPVSFRLSGQQRVPAPRMAHDRLLESDN